MSNVLITGCSSGFGELAAITFAKNGHRVFATMRNLAKAPALQAAATAAGVEVEVLQLDVGDTASIEAAVAAAIAAAGSIDVVVNNAGVELFGAVHQVTDDEVQRLFDTNVFGVVRVVRAVVPHMIANGAGRIVNVGSLAGRVAPPYSGIYAASKHALEAITEAMHFELSQQGIRVCVIEPGQFHTALGDNAIHAAAMHPGTPEYDRWQRFRTAMGALQGGDAPAGPQLVADTIYRAATEVPGQLRYPVGADADLVLAVKSQMSFEDFDAAMRATLNWFD